MTLRHRIIPCLLVHKGGLVKTTAFGDAKYVGDPLNAVRIFNEKRADELLVLDIDARVEGAPPNYKLISSLARECRMPLCYGGGIGTADQVDRIVSMGVEKVAIGGAVFSTPGLLEESARRVGSQSVAVVLTVRREHGDSVPTVRSHRGARQVPGTPESLAAWAADAGAGEVVINSIDRDGTMAGYDEETLASVRSAVRTPITILGGAGSVADMVDVCRRYPAVGAAAGSIFVFKGRYRAVLIQYPTLEDRGLSSAPTAADH